MSYYFENKILNEIFLSILKKLKMNNYNNLIDLSYSLIYLDLGYDFNQFIDLSRYLTHLFLSDCFTSLKI